MAETNPQLTEALRNIQVPEAWEGSRAFVDALIRAAENPETGSIEKQLDQLITILDGVVLSQLEVVNYFGEIESRQKTARANLDAFKQAWKETFGKR